jgi:hypothetical protein
MIFNTNCEEQRNENAYGFYRKRFLFPSRVEIRMKAGYPADKPVME